MFKRITLHYHSIYVIRSFFLLAYDGVIKLVIATINRMIRDFQERLYLGNPRFRNVASVDSSFRETGRKLGEKTSGTEDVTQNYDGARNCPIRSRDLSVSQ